MPGIRISPSEALFLAAELGEARTIERLLRPRLWGPRANLNARNGDGWTALHQAAAYGQTEVAKLLLDRGVRVQVSNYLGLTPLHYAACYGHREVALLLARHGGQHTLHTAAALGESRELRRLLTRGADVEAGDYFGYTPLRWAARHGQYEAAHLLLEHGADPARADDQQVTALDYALKWGHYLVAELLRQYLPGERPAVERAA